MELWVRSQDKMKLVKVNYIYVMEGNDYFTIYGETIDSGQIIAKYKTKERALEVLDEIQHILKPQLLVRRNDDNDKVLLVALQKGVTQKLDMEFKELSTYVYEMPKE